MKEKLRNLWWKIKNWVVSHLTVEYVRIIGSAMCASLLTSLYYKKFRSHTDAYVFDIDDTDYKLNIKLKGDNMIEGDLYKINK